MNRTWFLLTGRRPPVMLILFTLTSWLAASGQDDMPRIAHASAAYMPTLETGALGDPMKGRTTSKRPTNVVLNGTSSTFPPLP
jgi:hypothetical protein